MRVRRQDTGKWFEPSQRNFIAKGGEGAAYADGPDCVKIYANPDKMIPAGKIKQLAEFASDDILAPRAAVLRGDRPVGYVMKRAAHCLPLQQVMPKGWRREHGLDTRTALRLVLGLRANWANIHGHEALVVDANTANFLMRENLKSVVHIDVDSYGTRSYRSTAILPAAADPERIKLKGNAADGYRVESYRSSQETDWYSFSLLAFVLLIGAHPFAGRCDGYGRDDLLRRMSERASALRSEARLPPPCQSLDIIPSAWRQWFEAMFHTNERPLPPIKAEIGKPAPVARDADAAAVLLTRERDRWLPRGWLAKGVTTLGKEVGFRAGRVTGYVALVNATGADMRADEIAAIDGRVYLRAGENLNEITYIEMGQVRAMPARVGSVLAHSTRLFPGVAIQNIMGSMFASVLPRAGRCVQLRLKEIEGARLVDARFAGGGGILGKTGVLRVATERSGQLELHTWSGLERSSFAHHLMELVDIASVQVVELDTGIAVAAHTDGVELFKPSSPGKSRMIKSDRLAGASLYAEAGTLYAGLPDGVYRVKIR